MIRSGGEVTRLIAQLGDADPITRDAATARLRIVGPRAIDALTTLAHSTQSSEARCAALKALEGIDDPRCIDAALPLLGDGDMRVGGAAIGVLRQWVTREEGTRVLEALTAAALNPSIDGAVRLAALDAVGQLPRHVVAPLLEAVRHPAEAGTYVSDVRAQAQADPVSDVVPGFSRADDDPLSALDWLASHAEAPLSEVHRLIVRLRELEQEEPSEPRREQWIRARGAAHALLAARRSTVAVYDLREAFATASRPLPADFLTAVALVGDASCLEPMARAWTAATGETWWRGRLTEAAADIGRRENLTGRSAIVKRVRAKWPGFI